LKKNAPQIDVLFGLVNLVIAKKKLLQPRPWCACMAGEGRKPARKGLKTEKD
jgi:hypothetical protein